MDQGTNQQNIQPQTTQPVDAQIQQQPVAPVQPISGPGKETAPIMQPVSQEYIRPSEQEPVLAPEVKEAGVETVKPAEHIQVSPELKSLGVESMKTAVPVITVPTGNVQLPMTEEEAKNVQKTHPAVDSVRWFATIIIEQAKRLHKSLQEKGGQ